MSDASARLRILEVKRLWGNIYARFKDSTGWYLFEIGPDRAPEAVRFAERFDAGKRLTVKDAEEARHMAKDWSAKDWSPEMGTSWDILEVTDVKRQGPYVFVTHQGGAFAMKAGAPAALEFLQRFERGERLTAKDALVARNEASRWTAKDWQPGMGSTDPFEEKVRETFRRYYQATKDSAEAWNRTLDEIMPYRQEMTEEEDSLRRRAGDLLRKISREIETEEGDPFWAAVDSAMESLRRDDVVAAVHETWRDIVKEAEAEVRRYKKGPKEWSPRKLPLERGPKSLEEALEQLEGPYLYVMFDDQGNLDGWSINYPDYWQGHGGPVAAVSVHDGVTWDDIEREISEELGQAEIDWPEEDDDAEA